MNLSQSLTEALCLSPPPRFAARDSFVICLLIPSVTLKGLFYQLFGKETR